MTWPWSTWECSRVRQCSWMTSVGTSRLHKRWACTPLRCVVWPLTFDLGTFNEGHTLNGWPLTIQWSAPNMDTLGQIVSWVAREISIFSIFWCSRGSTALILGDWYYKSSPSSGACDRRQTTSGGTWDNQRHIRSQPQTQVSCWPAC